MKADVRARLLEINRAFYSRHAADFSATRGRAWPGWREAVPAVPGRVLDLGCGNARFLRYLREQDSDGHLRCYVGTDSSLELLDAARRLSAGPGTHFVQHDLEQPLSDVFRERFDLVTLFGVLHHVPGRAERGRLLESAASVLSASGRVVCTAWQFDRDERFEDRRARWQDAGIDVTDLETGDHLLRWGGSGDVTAVRYCHATSAQELGELAAAAGLSVEHQFYADGHGGRLNLYVDLRRPVSSSQLS